jgi:group I intron endonuclease
MLFLSFNKGVANIQYIYKIVNKKNGKFYVGRTNELKTRWNSHMEMLRNNRHHSIYLQNAWNKYGSDIFEFLIVEVFDTKDDEIDLALAKQAEQEIIDTYKPNIGLYNRSWSSETGLLRGEDHIHYGKSPKEWMSEEGYARAMMKWKSRTGGNNPFYGRSHSEATLQILRKKCALFGKRNGMYSKKHTEEYKKLKSEMMKGRYDGEKNPFYGKRHSEETKKIISQKIKGKLKGIPKPPAQRLKMVESSPKRTAVEIDGIKYLSLSQAERETGINRKKIQKRANSIEFPNYKFSE